MHAPSVPSQYLFIVARARPDILTRVRERLAHDPRLEVIADRRHRDRRRSTLPPPGTERRRTDRRRPTKFWDDLTVHPTLVAPRRLDRIAASEEVEQVRADNARLRDEVASLEGRITSLSAANEQLCEDNRDLRKQIASLQSRIEALACADDALRAAASRLCAEFASLQSYFDAVAQRLTAEPSVTERPVEPSTSA